MGKKKMAVLKGWRYYWGKLKFYDLRAVMTNRRHSIAFAFFERLFALINNQNVDIAYSNNLLSTSVHETLKIWL